jgi:hypothetical protein
MRNSIFSVLHNPIQFPLGREKYKILFSVCLKYNMIHDRYLLGNTILVKLELWESVMLRISFGLPLTYAYATLRQSVAGNSTFRGIVFCNLDTAKTDIKKVNIVTPYISPYGYPNNVPVGQKSRGDKKVSVTTMY